MNRYFYPSGILENDLILAASMLWIYVLFFLRVTRVLCFFCIISLLSDCIFCFDVLSV